jgi:ParB family chromosome partitioning protein
VFFSGRMLERVKAQDEFTKTLSKNRLIEFLDADGFSALYRSGRWFYQKFHDAAQTAALATGYGMTIEVHQRKDSTTSWQVHAKKSAALPLDRVLSAVEFEFNMPISDDRRLERHTDAIEAFKELYGADRIDGKA